MWPVPLVDFADHPDRTARDAPQARRRGSGRCRGGGGGIGRPKVPDVGHVSLLLCVAGAPVELAHSLGLGRRHVVLPRSLAGSMPTPSAWKLRPRRPRGGWCGDGPHRRLLEIGRRHVLRPRRRKTRRLPASEARRRGAADAGRLDGDPLAAGRDRPPPRCPAIGRLRRRSPPLVDKNPTFRLTERQQGGSLARDNLLMR